MVITTIWLMNMMMMGKGLFQIIDTKAARDLMEAKEAVIARILKIQKEVRFLNPDYFI
jgi:hypothetical protein